MPLLLRCISTAKELLQIETSRSMFEPRFLVGQKTLSSFFSKESNFMAFYVQQVQREETNSAEGLRKS